MPKVIDEERLAREAYMEYGRAVSFINVRGEPMPEWEDLGDRVRGAWRAAARKTAQLLVEYGPQPWHVARAGESESEYGNQDRQQR